jgi:hypothetical protein
LVWKFDRFARSAHPSNLSSTTKRVCVAYNG